MSEVFKDFLDKYEQDLKRNKIIIPTVVIGELENRAGRPHPDNPDAQERARKAIGRINKAKTKELVEFVGDALDAQTPKQTGSADAVLVSRVNQILLRKPVLVLTRDRKLKEQLELLTQTNNYTVQNLLVVHTITPSHTANQRPFRTASRPPVGNPFNSSTTLERNLDTPIVARETLKERSVLTTQNKQQRIFLGQKLNEGGEGVIYEIQNSVFVCKIYHNRDLTSGRQRKIEKLLERNIRDESICYPRSAVYDSTGTFRGVTMPKADSQSKSLGHSLFHSSFVKTHPQWNRKDSVRLALTILRKIESLHFLNILIGDINPLNILVKDAKNVYFVDCDSYQVEGFPCPVGTPEFTAPEIQGTKFNTFLRNKEHELFAIAVLLFKIFMPGKKPYACVGGEGVTENIKNGHFPYPLGERHAVRIPEGPCKYAWSHLSFRIKKAFNQCFHIDERNNTRLALDKDGNDVILLYNGRIDVTDWIRIIKNYEYTLNTEGYANKQAQVGYDLSIFPQNKRRVEKNGAIKPPLRTDQKTDMQADKERLITELMAMPHSVTPQQISPSPSTQTRQTVNQPNFPLPTQSAKTQQTASQPHSPPPKTLLQTVWDYFFN
jgi:serine/threonine protein kinase/rRNA-processing protein FCF1